MANRFTHSTRLAVFALAVIASVAGAEARSMKGAAITSAAISGFSGGRVPGHGALLDKPTFGEKFKMGVSRGGMRAQHHHDEFVNGVKGRAR